jgi:hypothetical protein
VSLKNACRNPTPTKWSGFVFFVGKFKNK